MSFLSKVLEKEEIIEVRQIKVRKYKINWKRLFSNFFDILMFWKKKEARKPLVSGTLIVNPEKIVTATSKEHLFELLKEHGKEIPLPKKDGFESFKFTKELVKWTVENSQTRDGFGEGGGQENAEEAKKLKKDMEDNKR